LAYRTNFDYILPSLEERENAYDTIRKIIGAKSKDEVTEFVRALPASSIMQWKVTPLEIFAHRADIEKKVVQGLRAQK
jgi:hypothetical protein